MDKHTKSYLSDGCEVVVARDLIGIETLRYIWEEMQRNESFPVPNTDIDRYITVIKALGDEVQPYIILLRQSNQPAAMAIARLEERQLNIRLGYKTLFNPKLRCLTVVYGGIIGQSTSDLYALLICELIKVLRRHEADVIFFNNLRTDTPLYQLVRKKSSVLCRDRFILTESHWQTRLPDSVEGLNKTISHSRRRYLRRYTKALEEACLGPIEVVCYCSEQDLDYVIKIGSQISSVTYKQALDAGFCDNLLTRSLLTYYEKRGWLRAYILYAGGKPCAFEFGTKYGKAFFPEYIGYDPNLRSCSPGTVLFIKVLEDLIHNTDIKIFDYGFGDAMYKERFGTNCWPEASVYIFAPRLYPVFTNILQLSVRGLNSGLKYAFHKLGYVARIKRRWRIFLQKES